MPISPDRYEANDSEAAATRIPTATGTIWDTIWDLSIHDNKDQDWFSFALNREGEANNYLQIDFLHRFGNLNFFLFEPGSTTPLLSAATATDNERISLEGLPAGAYLAAVHGASGATNEYSLTWNLAASPITPDAWEDHGGQGAAWTSNDTWESATILSASSGAISGPNIHDRSDVDWFRLHLDARGTTENFVEIDFAHEIGDLRLEFYGSDITTYDQFDDSSRVISLDTRNAERVDLNGLAAGNYYVRISGNDGATNAYTLRWDMQDHNPQPDAWEDNNSRGKATILSEAAGAMRGLTISHADVDWFKLTLDHTGTDRDYVEIGLYNELGDLDLEIYRGNDGDYYRRSSFETNLERIDLNGLAAGDWYVRVAGRDGATNNYELRWDVSNTPLAPAPSPDINDSGSRSNDTLSTATVLSGTRGSTSATIHAASDTDWYAIRMDTLGTYDHEVRLTAGEGAGNLVLHLYDARNVLLDSHTATTGVKPVTLNGLEPGTYYVRVAGERGATGAYSLSWDTAERTRTPDADDSGGRNNDSPATAVELTASAGTREGMNIHSQDDSDWFRIRLDQEGGLDNFVRLDSRAGAVDLTLELRSASGAMLASSTSALDGKMIMLNGLSAGEYLVRVSGADAAQKGYYSLTWNTEERTISPDAYDAVGRSNNTQAEAVELIGVSGMLGGLNIHRQSDKDWFRLHLDANGTNDDHVTAHFFADGARTPDFPHGGDLSLFLHDASGAMIRSSALEGYDNERILLNGLKAGDYYVRIEGADAQQRNAYTLSWNTSHGTEPDPEPETPVLKPDANPAPAPTPDPEPEPEPTPDPEPEPEPTPDPEPEPEPDPVPPPPPTTTFYMGADGFVGARGTARIFGSTGREGVFIHEGATDVILSPAVEVAHFTLASFAYQFRGAAGQIEVWKDDATTTDDATRMAVIPVGTELRFVDGSMGAAVNPETGQIVLGGKALTSAPATFYDFILREGVLIHEDAMDVILSPTVAEAHFALASSAYQFRDAAGQIEVWKGDASARMAVIPVGTELRFGDGAMTAAANPETGQIILGGKPLTSAPATFHDFALDGTRPSDPSLRPSGSAPLTAYLAENKDVDIYGQARVYGLTGTEKAYIHESAFDVSISPAVEEAHFERGSVFYRFSGAAGQIVVWRDDGSKMALLAPGTTVRFADGAATAGANVETGRLTLGGVDLTTTPTDDPLEIALDTSEAAKSVIRREEAPDETDTIQAAGVADVADSGIII